jgi:hypothetical protein
VGLDIDTSVFPFPSKDPSSEVGQDRLEFDKTDSSQGCLASAWGRQRNYEKALTAVGAFSLGMMVSEP